jgi:hypothetical protein
MSEFINFSGKTNSPTQAAATCAGSDAFGKF